MPGPSSIKNAKDQYLTVEGTFTKAESKAVVYPSARQAGIARTAREDAKTLKVVDAPEAAKAKVAAAAKKAAKAKPATEAAAKPARKKKAVVAS